MHLYVKKKKGIEYYYLRQNKRVDGKVVCDFQIYIGNKDKLHEVIQNGLNPIQRIAKPEFSQTYNYGAVASFLAISKLVNLFFIIDQVCKKRSQGLPISHYLIVVAINRAINAKSKNAISDWIQTTSLPFLMGNADICKITSQNFWNNMNSITEEQIQQMEDKISKKVVNKYKLSLDTVLYDSTNYYSYIHTFNEKPSLEQRGKNKQKRVDLRQSNFALLVTKEHHIPLFHKVYAGNTNDTRGFEDTVLDIKKKRDLLCKKSGKQFIVVFDTGNVCEVNISLIDKYELKFVSKLKPSNHKDLLNIKLDEYDVLEDEKFNGIKLYRTTKKLYSKQRTVVVKYNPQHYEAEFKTISIHINKIKIELAQLSSRLQGYIDKDRIPSGVKLHTVKNNVASFFKGRYYLNKIFDIEIGEHNGYPRLKWSLNNDKLTEYCNTYLGKVIYFTNVTNLTAQEVTEIYSYQTKIEKTFEISKDRKTGCWWPKYHWTNHMIRIHAFYCYLSLLLSSLLELTAEKLKYKKDINNVIEQLNNISEIHDIYANKAGKQVTIRRQTKLNKLQQAFFRYFKLQEHFT